MIKFRRNTLNRLINSQRGVALFFALIALVIMSLAAVALIRSVDTNTLIAGNLAFQQSATSSADAALEAAITQLGKMRDDSVNVGINMFQNPAHTMNITNASKGYYSNVDSTLTTTQQLTDDTFWSKANVAVDLGNDSSGNRVQYIIQRMCRFGNVEITKADCLFTGALLNNMGQQIQLSEDVCSGNNCPSAGQTPQIRVTARVTGPKNSASYVQAFIH